MSTFKAWLIANLEYVFLAACLIWIGLAVLVWGTKALTGLDSVIGGSIPDWGGLVILVLFGMEDVPDLTTRIIGFILFLGSSIVMIVLKPMWALWIIPLLVMFISIAALAAAYSSRYFQETVSRRTLYRNSPADIFEIKWKYAIDRFCYTFKACLFFMVFIALTVPEMRVLR